MAEDKKEVVHEDRIDDFAVSSFKVLGFEGRLPDSLVNIYIQFKRRKDSIQPGRVSPEGFATVVVLSDMAEGKINLGKKE